LFDGKKRLRVREFRPRCGERAERDGQDLDTVHDDVLVPVGVTRDGGPVRLGDSRPRVTGLHHVPVGIDDEVVRSDHDAGPVAIPWG
jgi:hypothetical protein